MTSEVRAAYAPAGAITRACIVACDACPAEVIYFDAGRQRRTGAKIGMTKARAAKLARSEGWVTSRGVWYCKKCA